jgi:carboxyl-terminal processing protease
MFRDAVKTAIDADAAGLILDIRNNVGGLDDMAAAILGSFYTQKAFYEDQNTFDPKTGGRTVKAGGTLYIEPAQDLFTGHVIALINQKCLSSGEGIALGIQNLDNGDTLGFYGTNGSFGLTGSEAKLPGGLTVSWPSGQSLGADGQIQLDSRGGIGGVAPTIRVPMTSERAQRVAQGEDIDLEEAIAVLSENR